MIVLLGKILGLIFCGTYLGGKGIYNTTQQAAKYDEAKLRGLYDPIVPAEVERELRRKYTHDWNSGTRRYFPERYHEFLERNAYALDWYIRGLYEQEEIRMGYKPTLMNIMYDKRTYNSFGHFDRMYREYLEDKKWQTK